MRILASSLCLVALLALAACGGSSSSPSTPPVPTGPIMLSVDISAGTVTFANQTEGYVLSGTSTDDGGGNATLNLSVLNNRSRMVFNLKGLVTSISDGSVNSPFTYQGDGFAYFGPEGLAPGASLASTLSITGLAGTTFDLVIEWVDHPMAYVPGGGHGSTLQAVDSSGTGVMSAITDRTLGYDGSAGANNGLVSPDGALLYIANRNQPALTVVDLTTSMAVLSTDLSGQDDLQTDATGVVGFVGGMQQSPDGAYLYLAVTIGAHSGHVTIGNAGNSNGAAPGMTTTAVVKLLRSTLAEVARTTIHTDDVNSPLLRTLSMSADGTTLACPVMETGEVAVLDTATLTLVDADPMTGGTQLFDVSGVSNHPRRVAMSADGGTVYVDHAGSSAAPDRSLQVIDMGTLAISLLAPGPLLAADGTGNSVSGLLVGPNGHLYRTIAYQANDPAVPGLAIYDPVGAFWLEILMDVSPNELAFSADGSRLYLYHNPGSNSDRLYIIDPATGNPILMEADGVSSFVPIVPDGYGHFCAVTPF